MSGEESDVTAAESEEVVPEPTPGYRPPPMRLLSQVSITHRHLALGSNSPGEETRLLRTV